MNVIQNQFIEILSSGIRGSGISLDNKDNINWSEIFKLAKAHKVEGIIYSTLNKSGLTSYIDEGELKDIKLNTFNVGIKQLKHIRNLSHIFTKIIDSNIKIIVLKGLVVREFYPNPEQRSMSDADILVKCEDIERVKALLINNDYRLLEDHEASHHMAFYNNNGSMIELHWNLFKRDGFTSKLEEYEKKIWEDTIEVKVGEASVLSLGYEDLALHLCMHMAAHLAATGFGVRQLCDLVLLVEKEGKSIDWNKFIEKSKIYKFEKFNAVIFKVCNILFNMEIPYQIDTSKVDSKAYIEAIISEIFESGVHGKSDMTNQFGHQIAFNFNGKDENATLGAFKRFIRFLFPRIEDMSEKYSYAKKVKILTPIAWIHHIFAGVFTKGYTVNDKFKFVTKGARVAIKRNQLLEWMELGVKEKI